MQLLTVDQVAEMFQVSKVTIKRWVKGGVLPVTRVGGVVRFEQDAIQKVIEDGKQKEPVSAT